MDDKEQEKLDPELQKELNDACKRLFETVGVNWTEFAQEMTKILEDKLFGFNLNAFSDEIRKIFEPVEKMLAEWDGVYKALKPHFDALLEEDPENAYLSVGTCTLRAVLRAESKGEVLPEVVVEYLKKNLTSIDGIPWNGKQSVTDFVEKQHTRKSGSQKRNQFSELGQLITSQNGLLKTAYDPAFIDLAMGVKNQGVQRSRENSLITRNGWYEIEQRIFEEETDNLIHQTTTVSILSQKIIWMSLAELTDRPTKDAYTADDMTIALPTPEFLRLCGQEITARGKVTARKALSAWQAAKRELQEAKPQIDGLAFRRLKGKSKKTPDGAIDIRPMHMVSYDKKHIVLRFDISFATYLKNQKKTITYFDTRLLRLDGKHKAAFSVALRLYEHHFIDANRLRGIPDKLQIGSLLTAAGYTYDGNKHSWSRIKEMFEENVLDELQEIKVLKNWTYERRAGCPMTDEDKEHIVDGTFNDYKCLYLVYELDVQMPQDWQQRALRNAKQKTDADRKKKERERKQREKAKEKAEEKDLQQEKKRSQTAERVRKWREKKKTEAANNAESANNT